MVYNKPIVEVVKKRHMKSTNTYGGPFMYICTRTTKNQIPKIGYQYKPNFFILLSRKFELSI